MGRKSTAHRREQIIDALLRVIAKHGYERGTIAKIATEAGLNHGLLHYHFKSKQEILLALLERLVMAQLDAIRSFDGSAVQRLDQVVDHILAAGEHADANAVAAWVAISAEAIRQPAVAVAYRDGLERFGAALRRVFDDGILDGTWHPQHHPAAIVAAFVALIQGYFALAASVPDFIPDGSAAPAGRALLAAMLGEAT